MSMRKILVPSKMELSVTIMAPNICQVWRIGQEIPAFIIYYPYYFYPVKSPALAIIVLGFLYIYFLLNQARFAPIIP